MIASLAAPPRIVIYEGLAAQPLPAPLRFDLLRTLLEKGYSVTVVRPGQSVSDTSAGTLIVLGLFDNAQPPIAQAQNDRLTLHFADIASKEAPAILALIESTLGQSATPKPGGWKPWFPVIDFKRCTNCMQCLSFCLFDVYGVSKAGKIQVQNENNCKTDCPACSRVCPEVAILFPKYRFGPINGDEIKPDDLRREAMKVDISALLGGDIYSMLRDRSEKAKSRFSKERDEDRALAERQRCMQKLQDSIKDLDIPAEVLSSLPSLDQIKAKAEQAKERAAAAIEQNNAPR